MPAYVKLGDIKGEATDSGHKDWIIIQSMGDTTSDSFQFKDAPVETAADDGHKDWIIIQSMSSPIFRSIPEGDSYTEVEWTYATQDEAASDVPMSEDLPLGYTEIEWTY